MAERPVANAMNAMVVKAKSLITKRQGESKSILGGAVVAQLEDLIQLGGRAAWFLHALEADETEERLRRAYAAISLADDLLLDCDYYIHHYSSSLSLQLSIHKKKPKHKVKNYLSLMGSSSMRSNMVREFRKINLELLLMGDLGIKYDPHAIADAFSPLQEIDSSEMELGLVQEMDDVKRLVDKLLTEFYDRDLSCVSLLGWGATGKTTLARLIYTDVGVGYHFDERMWVRVSVEFDIDKMAKCMLQNLTRSSSAVEGSMISNDRSWVLNRLQEKLKGKRFLLVLDDLWEENMSKLEGLFKFLRNLGGSRGSKVVITTCVEDVAQSIPTLNSIYHMKMESSQDYCLNLFEKIAFAEGGPKKNPALEDIGKNTVVDCQGNPLYVKLLASLMHKKRNEDQWAKIGTSERLEDLSLGIQKLCFEQMFALPLQLCFLYCFIFPKDYVIQKEELIQLWMGQGFLNPHKSRNYTEEDVGSHYQETLLSSSFLQVVEEAGFDKNSCKIHDLLRGLADTDFCITLENVDLREMDSFEASHLSLIKSRLHISKALTASFSKLRTLRLENVGGEDLGGVIALAEGLRVLIIVDGSVDELPNSIGMLRRLRYLDISRTRIVLLPDSISKLYNLQTLRLYDLLDLPRDFQNLENLRHFYIENYKDSSKMNLLPPQFRGLVNNSSTKASFKAFLDKECKIENLELWDNPDRYSSLSIFRLENITRREEARKAKLSRMTRIESLKFHWNARRENCFDEDVLDGLQPHPNVKALVIENFKGSRFPTWMADPSSQLLHKLVKLELENCSWCEQLPPLGHLPYLKILKILGMDNIRCIGAEFYGFKDTPTPASDVSDVFRALRELTLCRMEGLVDWEGAEQQSNLSSIKAFPFLEMLEVEQCPELISIPDLVSVSGLKYLRRLKIAICKNLNRLPDNFQQLPSLEDLDIRGLPSLPQFNAGCGEKTLKSLTIGCFSSDTNQVSKSIKFLSLKGGNGEVNSLPSDIQHLTTLKNLTIFGYGALETLPDWLANLKALQVLKLELCENLKYFPSADKMQQLTSLKELNICFCPLLEERCTRGSRPEWYKISRIPTINVNYETIHQLPQIQSAKRAYSFGS